MKKRARRNHTPAFKAKVALAALKNDRTIAQLAEQFDVRPNQSPRGKSNCLQGLPTCLKIIGPEDIKALHAKIGELFLENDFLEHALGKAGFPSATR
jgi:transposase